jgi:hypothetical protein
MVRGLADCCLGGLRMVRVGPFEPHAVVGIDHGVVWPRKALIAPTLREKIGFSMLRLNRHLCLQDSCIHSLEDNSLVLPPIPVLVRSYGFEQAVFRRLRKGSAGKYPTAALPNSGPRVLFEQRT